MGGKLAINGGGKADDKLPDRDNAGGEAWWHGAFKKVDCVYRK